MMHQVEALLELGPSKGELGSPEPTLESPGDDSGDALITASPTTRGWLDELQMQVQQKCPQLQYKKPAKYCAGFWSPSTERKIAYLHPQPNQIRLFLKLPPSSHRSLEVSSSSKNWGENWPSVYKIKSEDQIEEAVGLIVRSYEYDQHQEQNTRSRRLAEAEEV